MHVQLHLATCHFVVLRAMQDVAELRRPWGLQAAALCCVRSVGWPWLRRFRVREHRTAERRSLRRRSGRVRPGVFRHHVWYVKRPSGARFRWRRSKLTCTYKCFCWLLLLILILHCPTGIPGAGNLGESNLLTPNTYGARPLHYILLLSGRTCRSLVLVFGLAGT